jgi:hypothetical protein
MKTVFKKSLALALLSGAIVLSSAGAATIKVFDVPGSGDTPGGLFNAVTSANGTFNTFCLEKLEALSYNTTYEYTVSYSSMYNGSSTVDPISRATAWLFRNYTTIAGYAADDLQNNRVQDAIWSLEGENGAIGTLNLAYGPNQYYAAAVAIANPFAAANGDFNVRVLNLWDIGHVGERDYARQDVLGVPDGGITLALLGMAFGVLTLASRKIRA